MRTATIQTDAAPAKNGPPPKLVPFVRASTEATQPCDLDRSTVIGVNQTVLGPVDVPPYGFLRNIVLFVQATGGTGTAALYKEDAPWSILAEVALLDTNGAPIVQLSGYEAYLAAKWGGLVFDPDSGLTLSPAYVAPSTAGNFSFMLRIPVEVGPRDGLGALNNMSAASTYKLRVTQADLTSVYATNPTGIPTVRVRAWMEAWSPVAPVDGQGHANEQYPYAPGTTSYWTRQQFAINGGQQSIRLSRVGNMIRNLVLILRNATPVRSDTNLPDPLTFMWDSLQVFQEPYLLRKHVMKERYGVASVDTGVVVYDFAHDFDGHPGGEMRDGWIETESSSRLEISGVFGGAGVLTVITNDVVPAGNPYID